MELKYTHLEKVLDEFCKEFLATVRRLVEEEEGLASGNMYDKFDCRYIRDSLTGDYTIYLYHTDYFKYYDEGTQPHFAPIQPLKDWVEAKQARGMLPEVPGLPYMVRWKIAREGTEGREVFERAYNIVVPKYADRWAEPIVEDFKENYLNGADFNEWGLLNT